MADRDARWLHFCLTICTFGARSEASVASRAAYMGRHPRCSPLVWALQPEDEQACSAMGTEQVFQGLMMAVGLLLLRIGVLVSDKQPRVRWGNWLLPEARVPKVHERMRKVSEEQRSHERMSAVFPLPTDNGAEAVEFGSRDVRRIG